MCCTLVQNQIHSEPQLTNPNPNPMTNRYPSNCNTCRTPVPAQAGTLSKIRKARYSFWAVTCSDCSSGGVEAAETSEREEALAWSAGDAVSYGVITSSGWRGIRNRLGRCEDAPCCGCCTF